MTRRRGMRWGDTEVMRRGGGVAERVIGTARAAQDCGSREANPSVRELSCTYGRAEFCK